MTRTYVILNQEQADTNVLLNNTSVVTQTTINIDRANNSRTIGGQLIPLEQIRDFRANRLENNNETERVIAYTANIPTSPTEDGGTGLNDVLRQTIPTLTEAQRAHLRNMRISENDIEEISLITITVQTAIENLIETTSVDTDYALRIFTAINHFNSSTHEDNHVLNTRHLFHFNSSYRFSENFDRHISTTVFSIPGGTLVSRILNIFLALGIPFMNFVYSRFLELSNLGTINLDSFMNLSTQQFFVSLRHFLSGVFILFLGLDYFVSIDLSTFILALRSATLGINIMSTIFSNRLILTESRLRSVNLTNAFQRVTDFTEQRSRSFWSSLRSVYLSIDPYIRYFLRFPMAAGGTAAAIAFIIQLLRETRVVNNFSLLGEQIGPVTNFFREIQLALAEFFRRFRRY